MNKEDEQKFAEAATRILDGTPDYMLPTPDEQQMIPIGCEDAVSFSWGVPGRGFGQLIFYMKEGKLYCDNECMDKEFIKERLCKLVDNAELTEFWDK